ncbi:MAG: hypothetical protein V7L20_31225 [Nostoc sp.]
MPPAADKGYKDASKDWWQLSHYAFDFFIQKYLGNFVLAVFSETFLAKE